MHEFIEDYIQMNQQGLVLELCEKYYDDNVVMLSNGVLFAESMKQAYDKQKGYVQSVSEFNVKLISKVVNKSIVELTFHYKMTGADFKVNEYCGKHIQTWVNNKIVREEYLSV